MDSTDAPQLIEHIKKVSHDIGHNLLSIIFNTSWNHFHK